MLDLVPQKHEEQQERRIPLLLAVLLFLLCFVKGVPVKQKRDRLVSEIILTSPFTILSLSSSFAEGVLATDCCKDGSLSKSQSIVLDTSLH